MKKGNKILAINKPISQLTESEVDEILVELVKNGTLKKDSFGNIYRPDRAYRVVSDEEIQEENNALTETKELSVRCKICNREVFESDVRNGKNDINEKGYCSNCTE